MKTLKKSQHKLVSLLIASGILLLQSCVIYTQPREPLVKVPDIIKMSKDGVPSKDIISKIKESHTAYTLKADQLAKLQKQGVSDSVINYMEQTRMNSILRSNQYNNSYYGGPGWGGSYFGYSYGWPYSYGGFWGPTFIYRGGGGGHYGGGGGGHRR